MVFGSIARESEPLRFGDQRGVRYTDCARLECEGKVRGFKAKYEGNAVTCWLLEVRVPPKPTRGYLSR